jgi:hypothetical protein
MPFDGLAVSAVGLSRRHSTDPEAEFRLFPLPVWGGKGGSTKQGFVSLFVAAHAGASPPMVATLRLASSRTPLRALSTIRVSFVACASWKSRCEREAARWRLHSMCANPEVHANREVAPASSRQVASRRCGIALISSSTPEPGSGTEVPSRGGQSASFRLVRRAARRPESRSFARSWPPPISRPGRSPLCDS